MYSTFVIITLITLFNVGNLEERNSFYEKLPIDGELSNYNFGTQSVEVFKKSQEQKNYRLPRNVLPQFYDISIFFEKNFTYRGVIKIEAMIVEKTDVIVLHHANMEIQEIRIYDPDKKKKKILNRKYDEITELLIINFEGAFDKDIKILIVIEYKAVVKDNLIGFYKSSYYDENNKIKYLAATQFQAVHARKAIPCFDEPSFKANFVLRIRIPKEYKCLSNMPVSSKINTSEADTYFFKETMQMSTYLVAFVISDLESMSTDNFTVWARKSVIDQGEYAIKIGMESLKFFEKTFNQKYQIDKMDMVAVPDFAAGAMENWGLILYREAAMLYHKEESSDAAQQSVAATIAHECTHMWFGNLVTPSWWGFLWLSEGFARYYEYMATAKIEPTWNMEQQFLVQQHQVALSVDGLNSSAPLTRNVSSQSEIGQTGDIITYNKGASVLRMMEKSFGSEIFNNALTKYLDSRKYRNAIPEDLWTVFEKEIDLKLKLKNSVETIMSSWTNQSGFPVVSVFIKDGKAILRQKRFLLRNSDSVTTNSIWWIPITWTSKSNPDFIKTVTQQWINSDEVIDLEMKKDDWIVFNIQSAGFYRVNYDKESWYRIIDTLNNKKTFSQIHELNRAAIIDDLLNLARADYLDYNVALDGLKYLINETHYVPYKAAFNALEYLNKRFLGQKEYNLYREFIITLINKTYRKLSYDDKKDDNRLTILLRRELNDLACRFNHERCIEKSIQYFENWKTGTLKTIPKNRKYTVYSTVMRNANESDWDALWNRYIESNVPSEQIEILKALGCSQNDKILEKYLLRAVSSYEAHRIRKQDTNTIFNSVSSCTLYGAKYIMNFIDKHHQKIINYNGGSIDSISTILSTASQYFSTQELIDQFEGLINSHKKEFKSIIHSLESQLNLAKYELEWYKNHKKTIVDWIDKFNYKEDTSATTDYFLPKDIIPIKYYIHVIPHIEKGNFTFDGTVEIETIVEDITDKIILHAYEIKHNDINILVNGAKVGVKSVEYSENNYNSYNFMTISLDDDLLEGTHVKIHINYTGYLNNEMRGFYRSSYKDEQGETRWLAATHMEPVGARRMFPCFDEPAMKAVFVMSVTRPKSHHAISNMPLNSTENVLDGLQKDTFLPTPNMSTYLVALVVSQFASKTDQNIYKVWTRPDVLPQSRYALSIMSPMIKFYENKLNQTYKLPKMDMIALPEFRSGAMENWGLITYRERRMLYDPNESSIFDKQIVSNVVAHELAHQWFGNLVTPQWWKYLWLNEGFARYFQNNASDSIEQSWKLSHQFVVDHLQTSFITDGKKDSYAISHDVYSPSQISSRFDVISYAKAASILRMLEKIISYEHFYQSLQQYLKARQYGVATPEDLYKAFQDQIDAYQIPLDVKTFLDSWTLKPGFPVVSVTIQGQKVKLNQERFLLSNGKNYPINQTWWVPLTWTTKSENDFSNTVPKYWFKDAENHISIKKKDDDWIIFNIQEAGYYRVNYDSRNWLKIIAALKSPEFNKIHEINRASLIDDLFNLGKTGYVSYDIVLSATQYLEHETNYLPWRAAFSGLSYLYTRFASQDIYELFRTHVLTILTPIFEKLGTTEIEGEEHYDKLLRILVVDWACDFNHPECISQSKKVFAQWKRNSTLKVPANLRRSVYCTAIKYGSEDDWEFLYQQLSTSDFISENIEILHALSCSENPKLLKKLAMEATTEGTEVIPRHSLKVFMNICKGSLKGVETLLELFKNDFDIIQKHFVKQSTITSILKAIRKRISTDKLLKKFRDTINGLDLPSRWKRSSATNVSCVFGGWYDDYVPKIYEWLETTYPSVDYRLPKLIKPHSYNIYLKPYFEDKNFIFEGDVRIRMETEKITSRIILQSNQLEIQEIKLFDPTGKELNISSSVKNTTTHKLSIYLTTFVAARTKLEARIKYSGVLNDEMEGFYRSSYTDENKHTRWLATTQFQPTHARKAFPCFDEPSFKAKFTIQIERPNDYHTLSNMPLKSSQELNGVVNRTLDIFEESHLMSTYLVAFVISDFKFLTTEHKNFSIWIRPNAIENAKYSLNAATKVLKLLEDITGIPYTLPKMDLVAIPDFKAGAMENWGLVTFREYGLLYRDDETTAKYKKYINTTIAHEFAHMWFGDLVTCDWWDFTWLNEGFAQYFEAVITNIMEPTWKLMDQFVVYEMHTAMAEDASEKTHPMNNNVSSPTEISNGFDSIAYKKGASVIRMMHQSFGHQVFIKGIHKYLKKYQYQTTKPEHLWESIQTEADLANLNLTIQTLMDSWTSQPGHPVVNVTLINGKMILTQEQFLLSKLNSSSTNLTYWIPITYTKQSNPNFQDTLPILWFGNKSINVDVDIKDEWYILNVQQAGYYRVNYDVKSWYRLINLLNSENFKNIHDINRAQIIEDTLNFARVGYVNYTLALDATAYIINETNHLPWKTLFNGFSYLNKRFQGHKIDDLFAKHIRNIVQKIYKKLDFYDVKGESQLDELNRGLILSWACKYEYGDCVKKSNDLFLQWRKNSSKPISPNARPAVYCTALKHGTFGDWQFLWNQYLNTNFASEQVVILQSLGCAENVTTLNLYLERAISSNEIQRQDTAAAFSSVYNAGKIGLETCLQFLIENYKTMHSFFHDWDKISSIFTSVAASMSTLEQIEKLETFMKKNPIELREILPALETAVLTAKQNQQWFETHLPEINEWLQRSYGDPSTSGTTTSSSSITPGTTEKPNSTSQQPITPKDPLATSTENNLETSSNPTGTTTSASSITPETTEKPNSTSPQPNTPKDPLATSTENNLETSSHPPREELDDDDGLSIPWILSFIFLCITGYIFLYKLLS